MKVAQSNLKPKEKEMVLRVYDVPLIARRLIFPIFGKPQIQKQNWSEMNSMEKK
jgi:hypothetical protein